MILRLILLSQNYLLIYIFMNSMQALVYSWKFNLSERLHYLIVSHKFRLICSWESVCPFLPVSLTTNLPAILVGNSSEAGKQICERKMILKSCLKSNKKYTCTVSSAWQLIFKIDINLSHKDINYIICSERHLWHFL